VKARVWRKFLRRIDIDAGVTQSQSMAKPALGRGLGALMGGASPAVKSSPESSRPAAAAPPGERIERVAVSRIRPCSFQPRKSFSEESIRELADSLKEQGVLTPLLVRRIGDGYELIAGERRWRAAQAAGLSEVPVIVREADDRKTLELALIENLQREDLNAIEEALGYQQLADQFSLTQEQISARIGKPRSAVANSLRLLNLSEDVKGYVRKGLLSVGHAKLLLSLPNAAEQDQLARDILTQGLSVRALEDVLARKQGSSSATNVAMNGKATAKFVPDANVAALQDKLQQRLGSKVLLRYRKGKGAIEVRFFNDDDLERILQLLGVPVE
jgi:ParB family transcriptional regulator, chromosome partitioning protein